MDVWQIDFERYELIMSVLEIVLFSTALMYFFFKFVN